MRCKRTFTTGAIGRLASGWRGRPAAEPINPAKTVLRAGFGIFYDRFALNNTLTARRYNGIVQKQYVVPNPDFFPAVPPASSLTTFGVPQVIQEVDSMLRALHRAVRIHSGTPGSTLAVTYTNSGGVHILRSLDINAPLPGTYNPGDPGSGVFPLGTSNPLFLMTSAGVYNQHQLTVNINSRVNRRISLTGFYGLNQARSNSDGLGTFPANPYYAAGIAHEHLQQYELRSCQRDGEATASHFESCRIDYQVADLHLRARLNVLTSGERSSLASSTLKENGFVR